MALGRYLVQELGLADETDTLGRWMAHHIAELIDRVEYAPTERERHSARRQATDTILRLWRHRAALPGTAYPLAPYSHVLKVVARLQPSDNPFRFTSFREETGMDHLAATIFDRLSRLIIALLLMKLSPDNQPPAADIVAVEALDSEERQVVNALQQWSELFKPAPRVKRQQRKRDSRKAEQVDLHAASISLIDGMMETLNELRDAISRTGK